MLVCLHFVTAAQTKILLFQKVGFVRTDIFQREGGNELEGKKMEKNVGGTLQVSCLIQSWPARLPGGSVVENLPANAGDGFNP